MLRWKSGPFAYWHKAQVFLWKDKHTCGKEFLQKSTRVTCNLVIQHGVELAWWSAQGPRWPYSRWKSSPSAVGRWKSTPTSLRRSVMLPRSQTWLQYHPHARGVENMHNSIQSFTRGWIDLLGINDLACIIILVLTEDRLDQWFLRGRYAGPSKCNWPRA